MPGERLPERYVKDARGDLIPDRVQRNFEHLERRNMTGGWRKLGNFSIGSTSLNYSSIPQTFTHLKVIFVMQSNRASYANTGGLIRINGSSLGVYSRSGYYVATTSGGPNKGSFGDRAAYGWYIGQIPAGTRGTDDMVTTGEALFPFYRRAGVVRTYTAISGGDDGTNVLGFTGSGAYMSGTAAISSLMFCDDVAGNLGPRAFAELWAAA